MTAFPLQSPWLISTVIWVYSAIKITLKWLFKIHKNCMCVFLQFPPHLLKLNPAFIRKKNCFSTVKAISAFYLPPHWLEEHLSTNPKSHWRGKAFSLSFHTLKRVELLLLLKVHNKTLPEPHSDKKEDWEKSGQGGKYYRSLWATRKFGMEP